MLAYAIRRKPALQQHTGTHNMISKTLSCNTEASHAENTELVQANKCNEACMQQACTTAYCPSTIELQAKEVKVKAR